jgi:ParB family chromosome partitioning protein
MPEITRKPLSWFKVNPQVRKTFDEESLRRLGASLKVRQLQPVLVQPDGTIIAGERRLRAAQMAGLETLEVKIADRQLSDSENRLWQCQENMLREDLSGYERWLVCTDILSMNADWGGKELAEELHLDPSSITRLLSPSKCVGEVQDALKAGNIGISDCYAISKLKPADQLGLLSLKLSGASRDALEEAGRKARSGAKPAEKVSRVQLLLPSGYKIVVYGANCVNSLRKAFAEGAKEIRKAGEQNLSIKTLEDVLESKAKRGTAS